MAVITYEDVIPSLIENTTMKKMLADGVHRTYMITPNEGYIVHDKAKDTVLENVEIYDEETGEIVIVNQTLLGFATGSVSCGANYDFAVNSREFYAILRTDAPEGAVIFGGGGNNDHEIM